MALDVKDKRVLVIGAGLSGKAALRLLLANGADVTVTDRKPITRPTPDSLKGEYSWRCGNQDAVIEEKWDIIVISPGVSPNLPALDGARQRGSLIIGEVELAYAYLKHKIIGITGTNGKSSTTKLTGLMLELSGFRTFVGGNIGKPLSELALNPEAFDIAVVELSSFQLETIRDFKADIAVLLNIAPDHLDRYGKVESYAAAKARIFSHQDEKGIVIIPENLPYEDILLKDAPANRYIFGKTDLEARCAFRVGSDGFTVRLETEPRSYAVSSPSLGGDYNLENAMAATLAARLAGANIEAARKALHIYEGLPHRREFILEFMEVGFYDDSKATNVHAAAATLRSFPAQSNIILIAGGMLKEKDLSDFVAAAHNRVKAALFIGSDGKYIQEAFKAAGFTNEYVGEMEKALKRAVEIAQAGDLVLLAPATASYDAYNNYAERGDHFASLARALARPITGKLTVKPESKPEIKADSKPEIKADSKPEVKEENGG